MPRSFLPLADPMGANNISGQTERDKTSLVAGSKYPRARRGLSAWLFGAGQEPDPRFTLANERTFLAWIRTSLALLAAGIAVEAFMEGYFTPGIRRVVAATLLLLAMGVGGGSFLRWINVERSMRRGNPLPLPWIAPFIAIGACLVALAVIAYSFLVAD